MMIGTGPLAGSLQTQTDDAEAEQRIVLLATDRRWLRSALEEVISPEGFRVVHACDSQELRERAEGELPDLVIVDEDLPELEVGTAAEELVAGPLGHHTPLILYTSSSAARVRTHTRALDAGFWDLLADPLRPAQVVARLRRMLAISERMQRAERRGERHADGRDVSVDFLSLDELGRVLPAIGALAEREETSFSIVLLAPTTTAGDRERRKEVAASVCGPHLRRADLCAWINNAEVAIVAYDTSAEEAHSLVERLDAAAGEPGPQGRRRLSAAIVEMKPSPELERAVRLAGRRDEGEKSGLDGIIELFHLRDARNALSEARKAGGGVRVVDVE